MGSSSGTDDVDDYDAVDLPDTDALCREKWGTAERRAELLRRIRETSHPRELNQTELGNEFGVSQQHISKDFAKIGAHVRRSIDRDRRALAVNATVQRAIRGLLEQEDFYKAGKFAIEWDPWVDDAAMRTGDRVGENTLGDIF